MGITQDQDLDDNVTIQDGGGSGNIAGVTSANRLKVDALISTDTSDVRDFYFEVVNGNIPGYNAISKFGANLSIQGDIQDVWDGGGLYPFPTAAQTTTVSSTDTDDTSAGIGARTVQIYGLTEDVPGIWVAEDETVSLNGTTPVTLSNEYVRVNRMVIRSAGTAGANVGDVQVKHGTTIISQVTISYNQTQQAVYTTPSGIDAAIIVDWYAEVSRVSGSTGAKFAIMQLRARPFGEVFQVKDVRLATSDSAPVRGLKAPISLLGEKTDIIIRADADSNNTGATAGFQVVEVEL